VLYTLHTVRAYRLYMLDTYIPPDGIYLKQNNRRTDQCYV